MLDGFFENDKLNGLVKVYYKNGKLRYKANYAAGVIQDPAWREFYETGALHWVVPIVGDKKEGLGREYRETGELLTEGGFVGDQRHGAFKTFDQAGWVSAEDRYEMDRLVRRIEFYSSGKMKSDQYFYAETDIKK